MRYLFGLLCVCALGLMPLAGCDFDDLFPCAGVVCEDDGDPCTREDCRGGSCYSWTVTDGTPCTSDGVAGVCVEGVCGENLCEDGCDDDNACTDDTCDYVDGMCHFTPLSCVDGTLCTEDTCDPAVGCVFIPVDEGGWCIGGFDPPNMRIGVCEAGDCIGHCDPGAGEAYQCPDFPNSGIVCCPGLEYCYVADAC